MEQKLSELFNDHSAHVRKIVEDFQEKNNGKKILISSNRLKFRYLDDTHYPFYINAHFNYVVPAPKLHSSYVLFQNKEKPTLFYYSPDDFWYVPSPVPQDPWVHHFNVVVVRNLKDLNVLKEKNLKGEDVLFLGEDVEEVCSWGVPKENCNEITLVNYLNYNRIFKTPYEVECLVLATEKAKVGHEMAKDLFFQGKSECAIYGDYLKAIKGTYFDMAYQGIVAVNEHASILHYDLLDNAGAEEKPYLSFLLDIGATYLGYSSDITRTYWGPREKDSLFKVLVNRVDELEQELCKMPKEGMPVISLHEKTLQEIAQILLDLDIVKGITMEDMVKEKVVSYFFPHGLGHLLGLQVHDVGGYHSNNKGEKIKPPADYPHLRFCTTYERGQVFTIEPGIYFPDVLMKQLFESKWKNTINWERVEELKKYGGVRIEDNIYFSDSGPRNITREVFEGKK